MFIQSYMLILSLLSTSKVNGILFDLQITGTSTTKSLRSLYSNTTSLFGNSSGLNYYYVNLYLGEPSQRQSLIIDTGSTVTTVPCKQLCSHCGNHVNSYYTLTDLSQIIECKTDLCKIVSSSCSKGNCTFSTSYSEGSSLSGVYVEETVSFGSNSSEFLSKKMPIGCTTNENNLFYTQLADGIMGLSNNDKTFPYQMKKSGLIEEQIFSLCLSQSGGYFSLSNISTYYHKEEIQYVPTISSGQFRVDLHSLRINNNNIDISNNYFTIIDSGTTISYFPQRLSDSIIAEFNGFCKNNTYCSNGKKINDLGQCYSLKNEEDFTQLMNTLPSITFIFKNNVEYISKSNDYYFNSTSNGYLEVCLGFDSWGKDEILLGGTWMHNHDIIFDREHKKIGFALSQCNRGLLEDIPPILHIKKKCPDEYQGLFSIVYVILLCVIIFLGTALYYLRKGKKFLCIKMKFFTMSSNDHQVLELEIEKAITPGQAAKL